jgi:hypothetical protein
MSVSAYPLHLLCQAASLPRRRLLPPLLLPHMLLCPQLAPPRLSDALLLPPALRPLLPLCGVALLRAQSRSSLS